MQPYRSSRARWMCERNPVDAHKQKLGVIQNQYSEGLITSSIFSIILTTCVASRICCCFPIRVSKTFCSRMSFVPTSLQSIPQCGLFSYMNIEKKLHLQAGNLYTLPSILLRLSYYYIHMASCCRFSIKRNERIEA